MKIKKRLSKPAIGLLFFLILFSCIKRDNSINKEFKIEKIKKNDTLTITVEIQGKGQTGFDVPDKFLKNQHLSFTNIKNDTITIIKKIPKTSQNMMLEYKAFVYKEGKLNRLEQYYLINNRLDNIKLIFNTKNYLFEKNKLQIDSLNINYNKIKIDFINNKVKFHRGIDSLFNLNNHLYYKKDLIELNKLFYFEKLQMIEPKNIKIDSFIKQLKHPIASSSLTSLLYRYTKNRINTFEYNDLNTVNNSKEYLNLLAKGHFAFLRSEDNKGDIKYKKAINWLKTTDFYKKDSVFIKKKITPLNNYDFKQKIKNIKLINIFAKDETISNIINKNPSNFYLLDFWATWCAPCIRGVKEMREMDLPKNMKIISISLDKKKDKEEWISKTKELKQSYTYWLDESSVTGKSFLKFIELQTIPRYILIDKDLNLIDQAFYHPSESQFLKKLKEVKNHKYW